MGVVWCIGCPGAGKSTLARAKAKAKCDELRRPLLVVNCEGDREFDALPSCSTVAELPALIVRNRAVCFDALKASKPELRKLAGFLERAGPRVVLIDGAHALLDAHSAAGDAWVRLQRVHRHAELELIWTTHHLGGDVPQVVQACAPELYVFRTTSPAALKALEAQFGLDPQKIRTLERGNFVKVELGFPPSPLTRSRGR